eukprot:742746-Pyramimonas_sp.AAC.2
MCIRDSNNNNNNKHHPHRGSPLQPRTQEHCKTVRPLTPRSPTAIAAVLGPTGGGHKGIPP